MIECHHLFNSILRQWKCMENVKKKIRNNLVIDVIFISAGKAFGCPTLAEQGVTPHEDVLNPFLKFRFTYV